MVPPPGPPSTLAREIEPAKVFNSEKGTDYDVPDTTIAAVEAFKVPDRFQQEGSREDSLLYSLGN